MCSVAIQDRAVSVGNLPWVVQDNDLSSEVLHPTSWLILGVRGDIPTLNVFHRDVLDVKPNVVTWSGLWERLVVHLNRLDLCGELVRGECDHHARLDDSSLYTAHWNCSNTTDFVNILKMIKLGS